MIHFFDNSGAEGGEPVKVRQLVQELINQTPALKGRSINIILTDDETITSLHGGFLGEATPTDVISFNLGEDLPQDESISPEERAEDIWGEIYISMDQAQRQADELGETLNKEIAILAVHGLLHLAGHKDDTPEERQNMFTIGEKIMADFEQKYGRLGA